MPVRQAVRALAPVPATGALIFIAATFNVGSNLIAIPAWGYVGAAVTTILSEIVLLAPFWYALSRHVGRV